MCRFIIPLLSCFPEEQDIICYVVERRRFWRRRHGAARREDELIGRPNTIRVSSPGRVCLFGEHQDYLGLPVVPLAISLRVAVEGTRQADMIVSLDLPDIGAKDHFSLEGQLPYRRNRDYFRSAVNVMRRAGYTFSSGFDCVVHGEVPISAGTSSSSALVVSWVSFLARISDHGGEIAPEECARLAHAAEVLEFDEPGGMMDQCTASFGGLLSIAFHPAVRVERLDASLGSFVLGDSREPKDTMAILARVKNRVLAIAGRLAERHSDFSLHTVERGGLARFDGELAPEELALLDGTIHNRDLTRAALDFLRRRTGDHRELGRLLDEHQTVLRDILGISTPKIDRMLEAAKRAGAYGGKINGSGGGGCMFVYAPEDTEKVARAIEGEGGKAYIVRGDIGVREDHPKRRRKGNITE
jgi:galactokinase